MFVAVVFCILLIIDNEKGEGLERESYESENWKWVYWSIQMEFFGSEYRFSFPSYCSELKRRCQVAR